MATAQAAAAGSGVGASGVVYSAAVSVSTRTALRYASGAWDMATQKAIAGATQVAPGAFSFGAGAAAGAAAAAVPLSPRASTAAATAAVASAVRVIHSTKPSQHRRIRGVIFDLGGTLCGSVDVTGKDTQGVKASKAHQNELKSGALAKAVELTWGVKASVFLPAWQRQVGAWKHIKDELDTNTANTLERTSEQQLRECLKGLGLASSAITDAQLQACLEKFYEPELALRHLFRGVADMLHELTHVRGLRLALVTNSADTVKQKKTISLFSLDKWFNGIVISAEVGFRKPDSRIFQLVLDECWNGELERGEVVCVGDMLNRDVLGAHRMGMKCILLEMACFADKNNEKLRTEIVPDATISDIRHVPQAIDTLNSDFRLHPAAWHAFKPFTVGYLFNGKKASKFIAERVFAFPDREDVRYVPVDIDRPLHLQGPFDVLLLKFTDVQVRALFDRDTIAQQQLDAVHKWVADNPHMCVTEPFERVHTLLDRERVHTLIRTSQLVSKSGLSLCAPPTVVIRLSADTQAAAERQTELHKLRALRFPLICKALKACGSNDAHSMAIVRHADALSQISFLRPALSGVAGASGAWLFQELLEHNSRLYKVYVLNTTTTITVKPSLPSITPLANYTPPVAGAKAAPLTLANAPVLYFSSQVLTDLSPYPPAFVMSPYFGENGVRLSGSMAAAAAAAAGGGDGAAAADFKLSNSPVSPAHHLPGHQRAASAGAGVSASADGIEPDAAAVAAATAKMVAAKEKYKSSQSVVTAEMKASPEYQRLAAAVDDISAQLRAKLGLDLIGYDLIVHGGEFYIVDLNYLPSYNVVPGLRELMLTFLQTKAREHKQKVDAALVAAALPAASASSSASLGAPAVRGAAAASAAAADGTTGSSSDAKAAAASGTSKADDEWVTIAGYGSLLSLKSARRTCPNLRRFRLGAVWGYKRVFNLVSVSLCASGHARWPTREVAGLSAVPVWNPKHTPRPPYANAPEDDAAHADGKQQPERAAAAAAPAYSSAMDLIRGGSAHVDATARATTVPIVCTLFDIPKSEVAAFLLREHRYRFVEVDAYDLAPAAASITTGHGVTTPLETAKDAPTLKQLTDTAKHSSAGIIPESTARAILCVSSNDTLYRATRFPGRVSYRDMVGQFYGGALWRNDVKPVREYLRLCLQGAYDLGADAYANFLSTTWLGDDKTSLSAYIAEQPDLWPVQIRPAGVGPFGPPALMKPMPVASGVSMAFTTTPAAGAVGDAKSAAK